MSWLTNIQNKPQSEKLKIMWAVAALVALLLIAVWIVSARINKNTPKDTTLFKTIGRGVNDIRENFKK